MPNEAEVARHIRNLGTLPNAPALPDPDGLWVRAQIAAREDAAARALRMWALRQTLQYGLLSAGAAGLFLDWIETERLDLEVWISTLVALGMACAIGGLFIARRFVATRLKYLGLL